MARSLSTRQLAVLLHDARRARNYSTSYNVTASEESGIDISATLLSKSVRNLYAFLRFAADPYVCYSGDAVLRQYELTSDALGVPAWLPMALGIELSRLESWLLEPRLVGTLNYTYHMSFNMEYASDQCAYFVPSHIANELLGHHNRYPGRKLCKHLRHTTHAMARNSGTRRSVTSVEEAYALDRMEWPGEHVLDMPGNTALGFSRLQFEVLLYMRCCNGVHEGVRSTSGLGGS